MENTRTELVNQLFINTPFCIHKMARSSVTIKMVPGKIRYKIGISRSGKKKV